MIPQSFVIVIFVLFILLYGIWSEEIYYYLLPYLNCVNDEKKVTKSLNQNILISQPHVENMIMTFGVGILAGSALGCFIYYIKTLLANSKSITTSALPVSFPTPEIVKVISSTDPVFSQYSLAPAPVLSSNPTADILSNVTTVTCPFIQIKLTSDVPITFSMA